MILNPQIYPWNPHKTCFTSSLMSLLFMVNKQKSDFFKKNIFLWFYIILYPHPDPLPPDSEIFKIQWNFIQLYDGPYDYKQRDDLGSRDQQSPWGNMDRWTLVPRNDKTWYASSYWTYNK